MSESDWLAAIAEGGHTRREGISALYTQYAERFRAYYRRRGASPADAEECCQDAFVRLVRALDQGTVVTQPRAWLWQVAKSQWLDFCRRDGGTRLSVNGWAELADEAADAVIGMDGRILKRGHDLPQVLKVLERKLIRAVE